MNITPIQLARRVEKWRDRLGPLGLAHWRITCVAICDETPGGPDAEATVRTSNTYDSCSFYFNSEFLEDCTEEELDETIIHEWLHVMMRDLDQAIHAIDFQLAPAAEDQWSSRIQHEREGLIDRLSRQLYRFYDAN